MCNPICTMRRIATLVMTISLVSSLLAQSLPHRCLEQTRPHTTRCDQYLQCVVLPSKTIVWITTQCQKGLIYQHSAGFCVVPDSNWECELSADSNDDRRKENFYGIENVFQLSPNQNAAVTFIPATLGQSKQPQYNLPTVLSEELMDSHFFVDRLLNNQTRFRSSSASSEEFESSGEGSRERLNAGDDDNVATDYSYQYLRPTEEAIKIVDKKDSSLFQQHAANFKFKQSDENGVLNSHDLGTPLPSDGKIHPEHLIQIINQQKQLNLIAAERKQHDDPTGGAGDHTPFTNTAVFMQKPIHLPSMSSTVVTPTDRQHGPDKVHSFMSKEPYVSADIIRSIIEISQQMMVNQNPPTNVSTSLSKPITSPLPKNEQLTKSSSFFSANPIGITVTNPHNLVQSMVFDNLRKPSVNESSSYSAIENEFLKPNSNRFAPKEKEQSVNFVMASSSGSFKDAHTRPAPSKFVLLYTSPQQATSFTDETTAYSRLKHPLFSQLLNDGINQYGAAEHVGELDSTFDNSGFNYHSNSDVSAYSVKTKLKIDDISHDSDPNEMETQFKRKLFTLGNTVDKRNQYKDSILPLLNDQPNEVRISIVTCTLGNREPNKTDCFKYYVCNPQNGAFQSFTCPFFTAFNNKTRLCDPASYQSCRTQQTPTATALHTLITNKRPSSKIKFSHLQNELLTAQTYIDFINKEADKQNSNYSVLPHVETLITLPSLKVTGFNMSDSSKRPVTIRRKSSNGKKKNSQSTTITTSTITTTSAPKQRKATRKVPRCHFEGTMPSPSNRRHYYVCTYRKNTKKFVKMKMICPAEQTYCPSLQICTARFNCFSQE